MRTVSSNSLLRLPYKHIYKSAWCFSIGLCCENVNRPVLVSPGPASYWQKFDGHHCPLYCRDIEIHRACVHTTERSGLLFSSWCAACSSTGPSLGETSLWSTFSVYISTLLRQNWWLQVQVMCSTPFP